MLIIGVYVSLGFPFSIFGGVINGFQRYDLNNMVGVGSSVVVAIVNVAMLLAGCTLVQLVTATTAIRIATYFIYRLNAYHVFPALRCGRRSSAGRACASSPASASTCRSSTGRTS